MTPTVAAINLVPAHSTTSRISLGWSWFAICLCFEGLALAAAVLVAVIDGTQPDAHFKEGGAITYFSSGQLVILAGLAMDLFLRRRNMNPANARNTGAWLWLCIAAGMLILAADEAFMLHEGLDQRIHQWLGWTESPLTDRIDDLIVLLYGCIGVGALWMFRRELRHFRRMWPYLVIAFALFFVMVALDLLTNSYSITPEKLGDPEALAQLSAWANIAEESCKLFSEAAFLGAFVAMLGLARREHLAALLVRAADPASDLAFSGDCQRP